jgi:hypothetical protein
MAKVKFWAVCALALLAPVMTWAATGPVLIVHDGTAGLEANVVTNLSGKLTTAGYTVSTNVGLPGGSLAANKQIWDVRFNTTTPLTGGDISAYVTYLAGGGSLFVMGENTGFIIRDNSIAALVLAAGGGNISFTTPANLENVQSPFTGPTSLSTITFLAAAGVPNPGNGVCVTKDAGNLCASVVWGPGNMTAATAGSLIAVFDVNFLDPGADANSQTFTNNLIAYLAAPIVVAPPPSAIVAVPTLSDFGMILLAGLLIFVAYRKLPRHAAQV